MPSMFRFDNSIQVSTIIGDNKLSRCMYIVDGLVHLELGLIGLLIKGL
jgi:hypothetical protein